jgi:hypothetical protein
MLSSGVLYVLKQKMCVPKLQTVALQTVGPSEEFVLCPDMALVLMFVSGGILTTGQQSMAYVFIRSFIGTRYLDTGVLGHKHESNSRGCAALCDSCCDPAAERPGPGCQSTGVDKSWMGLSRNVHLSEAQWFATYSGDV